MRPERARCATGRLSQTTQSVVAVTAVLVVIQIVEDLLELAGTFTRRVRVVVTEIEQRCPTANNGLTIEQSGLRVEGVILGNLIGAAADGDGGLLAIGVIDDV